MPGTPKIQGEADEGVVLFIRGFPKGLQAKLKAIAALKRTTLARYIQELLTKHVEDLENRGELPRGEK